MIAEFAKETAESAEESRTVECSVVSKTSTLSTDAIRQPIGPAVISVQHLVHRYEERTALDGISFDVQAAALFGLLGPNGSGKTTLFRILSTLMIPTGGRATILGSDVARDAECSAATHRCGLPGAEY